VSPARRTRARARRQAVPGDGRFFVDLALQGGGPRGAFTWGVLARLLEEPQFRVDGISGTSAVARNAVVMASALMQGEPESARVALDGFCKRASDAARMSPLRRGPIAILTGNRAHLSVRSTLDVDVLREGV
jgi:predicted acylesterase/phospholipase RssA